MYPINNASPEPVAIGAVVAIADGTVQTSGVTVRIKPKGVAEGDGAGTTSYSTNGIVYYTPTQAETNYTSFILIAAKTSCIPVSVTVVTSASTTPGNAGLDWGAVINKTTTNALTGTTIATTQQVDVNTIKTQAVTCSAALEVYPFVGSTGAAINGTNANTLSSHDPGATLGTSTLTQTQVTGGAYALNSASFAFNAALDFTTTQKAATLARVTLVDTTTTVTNQLTAAAIATGVWQDTTAGDFTVASSIGKSLYTSGAVPGAAGGLFIAGTNAATSVTTAFTTTFTGNLTGNVGGNVTGSVGSVTGDIGGLAAGAITDVEDAVWDAVLANHLDAGSTGYALNAAGSAGDPWSTALPGAYASGTAGNIVGNYLDAAVTSRMATYTQPTGFLAATFPTTVASTTNITGGTITTVSGNVTGSVGSIATGGIAAASFAAGAIDAAALAADAVAEIWAYAGGGGDSAFSLLTNINDSVVADASGSVNDASATTTSFKTTLTQVDNFWNDALLIFTSGALVGQSRPITTYTQTNGVITFDEALTSAPANGVTFVIQAAHIHPVSQIATDVWSSGARTLTAGTNIQLPSNGLDNVTAWTVALTGNITGNLSGSVGSVSGAVGSVTGNVGGNVTGSVGSVVGAVGSVTGNVGGNVTGSVGSVVGAVGSVTGNVGGNVTGSVGSVTGLTNATIASAVLTTAMTESYNTDGSAATLSQAAYVMMQMMTEISFSSTTATVKKLDGSTTAFTLTINDASTPTSITRAT